MNVLLEIKKDTDIVYKTPPSTEEIEGFEDETGEGPELNPMRLWLGAKITHCWNNDLAEQFVEWFMGRHEVEESEESLLHEIFTNRFLSLRRRYNEWRIKEGEDDVQRAERVKEKHKRGRGLQRKDTRRNNVSGLNFDI
jgi:hypothetical protein